MKTKLSERSKHVMCATCKHLSIKSLLLPVFIVSKQCLLATEKHQLTSSNDLRNTIC